jgi:hypothetical protein
MASDTDTSALDTYDEVGASGGFAGLGTPSSVRRAEGLAVAFLEEGDDDRPYLDHVVVPATRPLAEFALAEE